MKEKKEEVARIKAEGLPDELLEEFDVIFRRSIADVLELLESFRDRL